MILTSRQLQCVALVAKGRSSKQIAAVLGVEKRTVDFHLTNAYRRLKVGSGHEAMVKCIEAGLIPCLCGHYLSSEGSHSHE